MIELLNKDEVGSSLFKCLCDCGNYHTVYGSHLKGGDVKSCGCIWADQFNKKRQTKIGLIYGRLTIVDYAGQCKKGAVYKCKCICGQEKNIPFEFLRRGSTKSCGCLALSLKR